MDSSLGFVSNPSHSRPIKTTRFRSGSGCLSLNLATEINSQARSPKSTPSGILAATDSHQRLSSIALRQIICSRFQVLFHSPQRGTFHLSLTVLVHYRSSSVFSLGKWSSQIPTKLACLVVLRVPERSWLVFAYGTVTLFGRLSHTFLLTNQFVTSIDQALQPRLRKRNRFGLFPFRSPLLRE
jgi:uncharacterized membrane protein YecN with MAPEG domain